MLNTILMFVRHMLFVITFNAQGTIFEEIIFTLNHGKSRNQWRKAQSKEAIKMFGTDEMLPWSKSFNPEVCTD